MPQMACEYYRGVPFRNRPREPHIHTHTHTRVDFTTIVPKIPRGGRELFGDLRVSDFRRARRIYGPSRLAANPIALHPLSLSLSPVLYTRHRKTSPHLKRQFLSRNFTTFVSLFNGGPEVSFNFLFFLTCEGRQLLIKDLSEEILRRDCYKIFFNFF